MGFGDWKDDGVAGSSKGDENCIVSFQLQAVLRS